MITLDKKNKHALYAGIFFDGLLTAKDLIPLWDRMDLWAERLIGERFKNTFTGWGPYDKSLSYRPKLVKHLTTIPQEALYLKAISSLCIIEDPFYYFPKSLRFSYLPPKQANVYHSSLYIDMEYRIPFDFSAAQLMEIMQEWIFLLKKQGLKIKYGYIAPRTTLIWEVEPNQREKEAIPDDQLMGIHWANLLTKQHLGKQPAQLLAAINRAIAPEKVVPIAPDLYWFTLPFDLKSYNHTNHPEYLAMVHKTLEAIKPYNVLWRNGTRHYF